MAIFGFFSHYKLRPWLAGILVVLGLALLHGLLFAWHSFVILRYERLYEQIQAHGATIQVSESFLQNYATAQGRTVWSRPDVLVREIDSIQYESKSLTTQYKNDVYRLHDTIVQHIRYLLLASEIGQEMVFPGQSQVLAQADALEKKLESLPPGDITQLTELLASSTRTIERVQQYIAYAERKIILQDILGFKHKMLFLGDVHRIAQIKNPALTLKVFWKEFSTSFDRDTLKNASPEELRTLLQQLQSRTQSYQDQAEEVRVAARAKRVQWVQDEQKTWEASGMAVPSSPLPDMYHLIYISLAQQKMYVYEDNDLILSTPITSGRNMYETIRGTFRVYTKQRNKLMKSPFPDEFYELWVDYWLGFSGGYGIHDACNSRDCWRTKYGGASYIYNGSHGCVNTPYNAVKFVYNWAKVGTTVYVK